MDWSYRYPAEQAVHGPTGLKFSITYDPVAPDRKVKLVSERPVHVTDVQVAALIQELQAQIQDRYLQVKMSGLLYGDFGGDYGRAALILEQQTKKRTSTRTLQAWMMPPGRPSSRRCPEWAVAALEQYLQANPDARLWWNGVDNVSRSTPEGRTIEHEKQLRERETVRFAEERIAREGAIHGKWQECSLAELPKQMAGVELATQARLEDHFSLINSLLSSLRNSDSFEDFKRETEASLGRFYQLERNVKETADDIRERKNEFAADDGTLPN